MKFPKVHLMIIISIAMALMLTACNEEIASSPEPADVYDHAAVKQQAIEAILFPADTNALQFQGNRQVTWEERPTVEPGSDLINSLLGFIQTEEMQWQGTAQTTPFYSSFYIQSELDPEPIHFLIDQEQIFLHFPQLPFDQKSYITFRSDDYGFDMAEFSETLSGFGMNSRVQLAAWLDTIPEEAYSWHAEAVYEELQQVRIKMTYAANTGLQLGSILQPLLTLAGFPNDTKELDATIYLHDDSVLYLGIDDQQQLRSIDWRLISRVLVPSEENLGVSLWPNAWTLMFSWTAAKPDEINLSTPEHVIELSEILRYLEWLEPLPDSKLLETP